LGVRSGSLEARLEVGRLDRGVLQEMGMEMNHEASVLLAGLENEMSHEASVLLAETRVSRENFLACSV
jgi:hypothetical protein